MRIQTSITQVSERMVNNVYKVFKLIVDESEYSANGRPLVTVEKST